MEISKPVILLGEIGAPGTIRTSGPQIRSLMLYPAELRARNGSGIGDTYRKGKSLEGAASRLRGNAFGRQMRN